MSKLMDKLKEAGNKRKTAEPDGATVTPLELSGSKNVVVMDRNVWYLSMMCVVFMGLVALILSFKAFVRIQRGNQNVISLGRVLIKQDKQMEALSAALDNVRAQNDERLTSLRDELAGLNNNESAAAKEDPRIQSALRDLNAVSTEMEDLKVSHRSLMNKLIELNREVNILRKAQLERE